MEEFAHLKNLNNTFSKKKNELNAIFAEEREDARRRHGSLRPRGLRARNNLKQLIRNKTRKNLYNSGVLDYIIVEGIELEKFTDDVMKKMAEGYILQGGISSTGASYHQALVKSNSHYKNIFANK